MKNCSGWIALLVAFFGASHVMAQGGIERMAPTTRALFEEGTYFEMSWARVTPELEGRGGLLEPLGLGTGDILESYDQWGFAIKKQLNCCTSLAITLEQPWGVNTLYPTVATSGYSGTLAELRGHEVAGTIGRRLSPNVTVYGGVRAHTIEASAAFPFGASLGLGGPYTVVAERDEGVGFLVGAAYEIKKIHLRLATTYYSQVETNHATAETVGAVTTGTSTEFTTPQSINIEFQSGVAPNTLAFGSVRWVDWSEFAVSPPIFSAGVGVPLVEYTDDWLTYTLGVGRKLNENWAFAILFAYTPDTGQELTTLGPIDGRFRVGIAPCFTLGNMKVTAGVSYITLGDAENFASTQFDDGDAIATGVRIGWNF